jgi:initiation factor 1A
MLGNGRLEALCFDGEKRLAHIRGKLRKKVWINQGDIILLSLRDYQDEKGDVILKYSADEARSLKAYGELPESAKINETDTYVDRRAARRGLDPLLIICGCIVTVTKGWMTTSSSTRIVTAAATRRRLMSMRSERVKYLHHSTGAIRSLLLRSTAGPPNYAYLRGDKGLKVHIRGSCLGHHRWFCQCIWSMAGR